MTASRLFACALAAIAAVAIVILAENAAVQYGFPHLERLTTDFSPAYLQRELRYRSELPPQTIFFGDSVVWGYRLPADETAVALLARSGCNCWNLSFKAGSPPNDYAITKLLLQYGIRPRVVVLQINQKVLSQTDSAYNTLHPALASLTWSEMTLADKAMLSPPKKKTAWNSEVDRFLGSASALYAMRTDVRETLFGDPDRISTAPAQAAQFEGAYDLTPLDQKNAGVYFLMKTVRALRAARVPVFAFMTPTNHALLHDYIDSPAYADNKRYLAGMLERAGVRVLDLDSAFGASDFYDNDHLIAPAQRRLAALLAQGLHRDFGSIR